MPSFLVRKKCVSTSFWIIQNLTEFTKTQKLIFDSSRYRTRKKACSVFLITTRQSTTIATLTALGFKIVLFFSFTEIPSGGLNFAWMNSNYHKTSTSQLMNIYSSPHVQKYPNKVSI